MFLLRLIILILTCLCFLLLLFTHLVLDAPEPEGGVDEDEAGGEADAEEKHATDASDEDDAEVGDRGQDGIGVPPQEVLNISLNMRDLFFKFISCYLWFGNEEQSSGN